MKKPVRRAGCVLLRVYARWVPEGLEPLAAAQPAATQTQPETLVKVLA